MFDSWLPALVVFLILVTMVLIMKRSGRSRGEQKSWSMTPQGIDRDWSLPICQATITGVCRSCGALNEGVVAVQGGPGPIPLRYQQFCSNPDQVCIGTVTLTGTARF
jgi:hypothetical protein